MYENGVVYMVHAWKWCSVNYVCEWCSVYGAYKWCNVNYV